MVFLNQGLNVIRDLLKNAITTGQLGTNGTSPDPTQTNLVAPTAATQLTVTKLTADRFISVEYLLPSTLGNGIEFKEFAIRDSSASALKRGNFAGITKTNTKELVMKTTITIEQ